MRRYEWIASILTCSAPLIYLTALANEDGKAPAPPAASAPSAKARVDPGTFSLDQVVPDQKANPSKQRLARMRSSLEAALEGEDLKDFQRHLATLKTDDQREAYYNNECTKFDIDC